MYPLLGVALFQICLQRAVDGLFRVDGFLDALPAHHRQPRLEGLGLFRGNGLDNAQKLLRVGNIGETVFAVCRPHFQTVTVCHGFVALCLEPLLQLTPVCRWVSAVGQDCDHIHNGEVPFLPFRVPRHANLLILEKLDRVVLRFFHLFPPF